MVEKRNRKLDVMYALADDYEDLATITQTVQNWASSEDVMSAEDVQRTLAMLHEGLIQAYRFQEHEMRAVETSDVSQPSLWFFLSPPGLALVKNTGPRKSDC